MRRAWALLGACLLGLVPATAGAGSLELRGGGFFPSADSNLFDDDQELYTTDKDSDWDGFTGGIEYAGRLGHGVELGIHLDGYGRTLHTSYRDFVRPSGREITQSLKLNTVPLGFTLRLVPTGQHGGIAPYVGVGADIVFYRYEEFGDFVDFDRPNLPIITDSFISEGAAPGFHVAAGLRVPISHDFRLTGEVRYLWAKDDMGDDFRGNRIDLGGLYATAGLNIRF